ncbi:MAG: hypothetical protein KJ588_03670, partial [Gammaproteobacteria bacterium]|nr:hypothetical protein [Gammaproteobacteria bacterium]
MGKKVKGKGKGKRKIMPLAVWYEMSERSNLVKNLSLAFKNLPAEKFHSCFIEQLEIHKDKTIDQLDLSGNDLNDTTIEKICETLQEKKHCIQKLLLSANNFGYKGASAVAELLKNSSIHFVDLSGNFLSSSNIFDKNAACFFGQYQNFSGIEALAQAVASAEQEGREIIVKTSLLNWPFFLTEARETLETKKQNLTL